MAIPLPQGWKSWPVNVHETFKIQGGPNDWDMWLSLREKWRQTRHNVGFLLDRPLISRSEGTGFGPEFMAKITSMSIPEDGLVQWEIAGRIYAQEIVHGKPIQDRRTLISFKATYSHHDRIGEIQFREE